MREIVSLVFIFLCLASGASRTAAQDLQNTEAEELDAKVIKLYQEGQAKKALPLAKRAVELRSAKPNRATVGSLYNLAAIHEDLFDFKAALPLLEAALKMNQALSPDDIWSATILEKIGRVHHSQPQGDASAARAYGQSLSIKEKVLGEQHPNVIQTVLRLALLLTSTGENEKAERLFDRFFRSKDTLSADLQSQSEKEIQQFACSLRSLGNPAGADKLEAKLSIIPVTGSSDSGNPTGTEAINGRATHLSQPPYPAVARSARASGKVSVRVVIDETGQPIFTCVLNGHPLLQGVAREAALESRFTPTLRNGRAVRVAGTIIYNFIAK